MTFDDATALQVGEIVGLFQAMPRPDREALLRFARVRAAKHQAALTGSADIGGAGASGGGLSADEAKSSI